MDQNQLKQLYKDIRENTELSEKGGAGLGLIEMARKTGNKLDFEFKKANDELSFFYLQLRYDSPPEDIIQDLPIAVSKDFHDIMKQNNTYLTYK